MNAVTWFEIYVNDMDKAKTFYESVFAVKLEHLPNPGTIDQEYEMWSFGGDMEAYGACGALVRFPGVSAGNTSVIIYFTCEDCAVEEKRVEQYGGKIQQSKFSIGEHGFCSVVVDPEGNTFGLHSMK